MILCIRCVHARTYVDVSFSHCIGFSSLSIYFLFVIFSNSPLRRVILQRTIIDHWDGLFRDNFEWLKEKQAKKRIKQKKWNWNYNSRTIQKRIHRFKWKLFPRFSDKQRNVNIIRGIHFFSYVLWYLKSKSKECNHFKDITRSRREKRELRWFFGK